MAQTQTAVYVVLAILIIAFIFFVANTIRCYLNKPRYVDQDDQIDNQMSPHITSSEK